MGQLYYKNDPLTGPQGPEGSAGLAGPDGNAIGTIISFMGTAAPDEYLVCDGAVYSISAYSDLADFFLAQFGSKNYFGGNGTSTFAVPDLRNLFLRGYHGNASEQLSGEIGKKQDGTEHINFTVDSSDSFINYQKNTFRTVKNADSFKGSFGTSDAYIKTTGGTSQGGYPYFTSRPVNAAVLFCIKYTKPKTTLVVGGMSEEEADAKYATPAQVESAVDALSDSIPTKTSELQNDSGFITQATVPTKTSQLVNDSGFATGTEVTAAIDAVEDTIPTKTSELQNDAGFITQTQVGQALDELEQGIPTKTSELQNDSGFITNETGEFLPLSGGTLTGTLKSNASIIFEGSSKANNSLNPVVMRIQCRDETAINSNGALTHILAPRIEYNYPDYMYGYDTEYRDTIIAGLADPISTNHAATKRYVDNAIQSAIDDSWGASY